MTYLVVKITNYGNGAYPLGTFRSRKDAQRVRDELNDWLEANIDSAELAECYTLLHLKSLDKYEVDSLISHQISKYGENQ